MRCQSTVDFIKYTLVASIFLLPCSCSTTNKVVTESSADCSLQVQNSVSLTAIRYISILDAIQNGTVDRATQDMDWWIDQAIIELMYLEKKNPDKKLEENAVPNSQGLIRYKRIYRDIARYRAEHPRTHKVPLDNQQLKMIDDFVSKYNMHN